MKFLHIGKDICDICLTPVTHKYHMFTHGSSCNSYARFVLQLCMISTTVMHD